MKKLLLFAAMCCFVINAWGIEYTPCQSTGLPNYFQSVYSYIDAQSEGKYVCFDDVFNPTLSFSSRIYDVCAFGYTGSTQMYKWHYDMYYYDCFDYGTYQNNTFTSTIIKKNGKVVSALGGGYSPDGNKGGWSSVPVGDIIDAAREMGYDRVVFAIRGFYALSEGSAAVGYLNLGQIDVGYIECMSGISEPVYITDPHEITIDAREMWCDVKIDSNHGRPVEWNRLANSYYSYRCIDDTVWIKDSYKKGITDVEVSSAKCVKGKKDGLYYVTGFTENTTITPVGKYSLSVKGEQVTSDNCADILGDRTVSYNDATKTLTLNNATISCDGKNAINISESQPVTIECIGTNTITTTGNAFAVVNTGLGGTTFTGSGSVNMSSYYPTYFGVMGPLKIQDGCSVTLQSSAGSCIGAGAITVDGANLVAKGNGSVATIICSGLVLKNAEITSKHTFNTEQNKFLNEAGEEAKDGIIINSTGTALPVLTYEGKDRKGSFKYLYNGHLLIERNGKTYDAQGMRMK